MAPDADAIEQLPDSDTAEIAAPEALPAPDPKLRHRSPHFARPGDLTAHWQRVTLVTWIMVLLSLAAVWSVSVQLGLATWWLGPRGDRHPIYIQLLPFVPPVVMQVTTLLGTRWTAVYGLFAAFVIAFIGVFDFSHFARLAWLEVAIGVAAALISVASLTGTYRSARP